MSDPFGRDGRPFTHEGFTPVPPDEARKSKRSYRAVSPKQITLGFLDQWNVAPPSTAPALRQSQQGQRPHRQRAAKPATSSEASRQDESLAAPLSSASRPVSSGFHLAASDDFLKPSPRQDLSPRPTSAAVHSTQFPSLSNRLRAQISIAPAASAAIRTNFSKPASAASNPEGFVVSQPPLHSAHLPPSSSSSSSAAAAAHRPFPRAALAAAPAIPRTDSVESIQASLASTQFEDMNVRQVLEYFLDATDQDTTARATFVHVAPRYHIEPIPKPNFYDLVVLERPGFPHSGFVWSREHIRYAQNYHVLPSHKIMQLSLQGLLVQPDASHPVELIPIPVFLHEKHQFNSLRKKRFFGFFHEIKAFRAWHRYTQQAYVLRMKHALLKDSFFSDQELVNVQGEIVRALYQLEETTELFAFSPKGLVCVTEYFSHQLGHIEDVSMQVVQQIQALAEKITQQHQAYLSSKRLADLIQEVKDHHPLRDQMREDAPSSPGSPPQANSVDWIRLRSIQRLEEIFKQKLKALVRMAQYRAEEKIALLIERFWRRFKQQVIGLPSVRGKSDLTNELYWDSEASFFNSNGTLRFSAFEANEALAKAQTASSTQQENGVEEEDALLSAGPGEHLFQEIPSSFAQKMKPNPALESEQSLISKYPTTCAKVSTEWEKQGCHLSIHIELYLYNRVMEIQDLVTLQTLEGVSIAITPNKTHLLNRMHQLCGALGRLIESIPDLNKHPLIYVADYRPVYGEPDVDLGLGDLNNAQSSNYFTALIMHPTYNSRHAYQLAVDSIRLLHAAYTEAASIESHVFRLFEIVRKLWSIAPTSLVRQIERSVAIPKIRAFIDQPDSVEDLRRSQMRDKSRLAAFRTAATYLDALPAQLERVENLKHRIGLVSSFVPLIGQISIYRAIQDYYLHQRLPSAYSTRCMIFYEFVRRLELSLDSANKSPMELIDLMRKLKHFDHVKEYFDGEMEFCETMFHILVLDEQRHKRSQASAKERLTAQLLSTRGRLSAPVPIVQPEKLHKLFEETMERLSSGMSRLRSYLLSQLGELREAVLDSRQQVHGSIRNLQERVQEFEFVMEQPEDDDDEDEGDEEEEEEEEESKEEEKGEVEEREKEKDGGDVEEKTEEMGSESESESESGSESEVSDQDKDGRRKQERRPKVRGVRPPRDAPLKVDCTFGSQNERILSYREEVNRLRRSIDSNVSAQHLLLESHDIVGAANPILLPSQVDSFVQMESLEKTYDTKCLAWKVLKEMAAILSTLMALRVSAINVTEMYEKFVYLQQSVEFLRLNLEDKALLDMIEEQFQSLTPKIELVAFLASKALRSRHWTHLALYALRFCGIEVKLSGKQSEFVALMDVTGRDPVGLGNVNRVMARDLFIRNVEKHLRSIKFIVSEAVIESYLEATLDSVNDSLRLAMVQTSGEWLRDSRLRERVLVELNEITNLHLLRVLSRYCWKAILLVDATAQDMGLLSFDVRLSKSKDFSQKIDRFLETYTEAQYYWFYVLHFVKFAARGELDRDSIRSFHSCTEEMKKMEVILQQKSGNLYAAFLSSNEGDLSTDLLRSSLFSILDDVHSHVQSLMDSCPRLSLLSYNRLVALARAWLTGPQQSLAFISSCFGEMFEGVGALQVVLQSSQKIYVCQGFVSQSKVDKVIFPEAIPLNVDLDVFVLKFSDGIRLAIEKTCDLLILHRINCMKALLSHATADVVVQNMQSLFNLRVDHLEAMIQPDVPLSAFLLINSVSYAEDLWTCLGHPTGSLTMARPDLVIENVLFSQAWKELLGQFVLGCENNLTTLQAHLVEGKIFARTPSAKGQAILSGWVLQEMYYLQVAQRLLRCDCVESAIELWMGHYQLRFQYSKEQRYRSCPMDVILGNISIPYGMEYQESGTAWLPRRELDYVLSRVFSSAFSVRGTTLVHATESNHVLINQHGELNISGADIAYSLGRICTTLVHPGHLPSVRFFFARMVLLDAVGCVDFTTINQLGLQNVIQAAQMFWSALDNKNDQVIQESLKYPLRSRFTRNEIHSERRKSALRTFRSDIFVRQKLNLYVHFLLIGFGSETEFKSLMVSDQFYRSVFDAVTVPYAAAYTQLGALLSSAGFVYGLDIQASFVQALQAIFKKAEIDAELDILALQSISTLNGVTSLVRTCKISMNLSCVAARGNTTLHLQSAANAVGSETRSMLNPVARYRDEVLCFCSNLWEKLLSCLNGRKVSIVKLRNELLAPFLAKLEPIAMVEDAKLLKDYTSGDTTQFRDPVNYSVIKAANSVGLICKSIFVQLCAQFLDCLQTSEVPVVILHGDPSVGKTAVWKTAVTALSRLAILDGQTESQAQPVALRLAAAKILSLLRRNALNRKLERWREMEREKTPEIGEPGKPVPKGTESRRGSAERKAAKSAETSPYSVAVIFHASLSSSALLGGYDSQGRWMDGILVRKIRCMNEQAQASEQKRAQFLAGSDTASSAASASASALAPPRQYFIVLNGPITMALEQLLHGLYFQSFRGLSSQWIASGPARRQLLLPTNEYLTLGPNVRIIIETNDLSNASPACLNLIPSMPVFCSSEDSIARLLGVWTRSMSHWLGDFLPWLDFMDELNKLLLSTKFVEDLLYEDLTSKHHSTALVNARIGAFLRILEELLLQCHELALQQAVFHPSAEQDAFSGSESSDSESDTKSEGSGASQASRKQSHRSSHSTHPFGADNSHGPLPSSRHAKNVGAMSLNPRAREILLLRARLSVIYAAIWGFGGTYNGTDKRKFFDNMLRDNVQNYMDESLAISTDCLVFELVLDLEHHELIPALQYDKHLRTVLTNPLLTQKQLEQHVYCEWMEDMRSSGKAPRSQLVFRSMSTRAVASVFRILLASGANVLMFGPKGCGKTRLILETLDYLSQCCPSPSDLRKQIVESLLEIAAGTTKPQGIIRALEIVRAILPKIAKMQASSQSGIAAVETPEFNDLWRGLNSDLELFMSGSSRYNCQVRAVSSAVTSLTAHTGAREVRSWLEREFATEVPNVLETARFSYGLAFIDDVHCLASPASAKDASVQESNANRVDELLRGLLDGFPAFSIARKAMMRSSANLGYHAGSVDGSFRTNPGSPPILHREILSDVRIQMQQSDDFMLQRMGLVCAATGQYNEHSNLHWLRSLGTNFAMIGLPPFSSAELHVAVIAGTVVSMMNTITDKSLLEVLQSDIADLSRITLNVCSRMIGSADLLLTTSLERVVRSMTTLDISLAARFCSSLRYGCAHVKNPGGLLQLFVHEWKRHFFDPLPQGNQRDRFLTLFSEQLDGLDEKSWAVSHEWMKELKDELAANIDRVWVNASIFKGLGDRRPAMSVAATREDNYIPVGLDTVATNMYMRSGAWSMATQTFSDRISIENVLQQCGGEPPHTILTHGISSASLQSILYPAALSLLLRIVRILTVSGKHLLLAGYPGSTRNTSVLLAAKICNLQPFYFAVKESQSVSDTCSAKAASAFQLKAFIKTLVLRAAGLSDPITAEDYENSADMVGAAHGVLLPGQVHYDVLPGEEEVVMVLDEAQQLSEDDRRHLRQLVEYGDPSGLFSDNELHGMVEALRRKFKFASEIPTSSVPSSPVGKEEKDGFFTEEGEAAALDTKPRALPSAKSRDDEDHGAVAATDNGVEDEADTPLGATSSGAPMSSTSQGKQAGSIGTKTKNLLTGYMFHWIKSYLQASVHRNVHVVLSMTLSRSVEINPRMFYSNRDSLSALRKLTGHGHAKKPKGNTSKSSASSSGPRKTSVSNNPTGRRFSVRSDRSSVSSRSGEERRVSNVYNPAAAAIDPNIGSDAFVDLDESGEAAAVASGGGAGSSHASGSAGQNAGHANLSLPVAVGLFTCPILGPLLHRQFHLIWYDIDSNDAISGICTVVMKNVPRTIKPTPFLLSLRSSAVGVYSPANAIPAAEAPPPLKGSAANSNRTDTSGAGASGAVSSPSATTPALPPRRMSVLEKQAMEKEEKRRQKFLFSSAATNKCHLVLHSEDAQTGLDTKNLEDGIFSISRWFGVLQSFRNDMSCAAATVVADTVIPFFVEEARSVLPQLLALPLPCDGLFLRESVFTLSAERMVDRAARTVMRILQQEARGLIERKYVIEQVLVGLQDAAIILENDTDVDTKLIRQNDELTGLVRKVSKQIEDTALTLEKVPLTFQHSIEYEREQMLKEDFQNAQLRQDLFLESIQGVLQECREQLQAFTLEDWQGFRSLYLTKPYPKPMIEIMRAVMIVIPFTPPRIFKGEKGSSSHSGGSSSAKMDDEMVARCAASLLVKYGDLAQQLCAIQALGLTTTQFHALRVMNSLLNSSFVSYFNADYYSPPRRWVAQKQFAGRNASANPFFDCLRVYFLALDMMIIADQYVKGQVEDIGIRKQAWEDVLQVNQRTQAQQSFALREVLEKLTIQSQGLDFNLIANRKKLDIIDRNRERKPRLSKALSQLRNFVEDEYSKLNHILKCLVGDVCIVATLLHRCGWLPESMRQDCLEELRRHLRFHKMTTHEGPFLAGCLFDRLQYRQFLSFQENMTLGLDVPSINAVSMLYLAPKHVFVIDPDGVAPQAIMDSVPKGYDIFSLAAQKFSLSVLEAWVQAAFARDGKDCAMFVILYDLQAGASDDLICFLTAQVDPRQPCHSSAGMASLPLGSDDLEAFLPRLKINSAMVAPSSSTATGSAPGMGSKPTSIFLPSRFRLVLVSTRPPVFNAFGETSPLPIACMEDITVLHWPSASCSFYLEPKPLEATCEKLSLTSSLLPTKLAMKLLPHLNGTGANNVLTKLQACNQQIVDTSKQLFAVENQVITTIYQWLEQDRLASATPTSQQAAIEELFEQKTISLSILSSEQMIEMLFQSIPPREELQAQLVYQRLHLREQLAYLESIGELFSMAGDYLRLVGFCLPIQDLFAPYCFTPMALVQNFLPIVLASPLVQQRFLHKAPSSIYAALRVYLGITALQRRYRQWKKGGSEPPSTPRESGRKSSLRKSNYFERSSILTATSSFSSSSSSLASSSSVKGMTGGTAVPDSGNGASAAVSSPSPIDRSSQRVLYIAEQNRKATEEHGRLSGLAPSAREKGLQIMHYCLCSLRGRIMREIVRFAELNIRPGYEYLVKYLLLLSIWAQTGEGVTEEARALFHFLFEFQGVQDVRYVHLLPLKRQTEESITFNRLSGQYLRQSNAQWSQQMNSTMIAMSNRAPPQPAPNPRGALGGGVVTATAAATAGGADAEAEEGFLDELPGQGKIKNRVTAFRIFHAQKATSSAANFIGKSVARKRRPNPLWSSDLLLERGEGCPDGIYFNRRSTMWSIVPRQAASEDGAAALAIAANRRQSSGYRLLSNEASGRIWHSTFLMADHQLVFQLRNNLVRPPIQYGDAFEVEWLKNRGVRAFHTLNTVALQTLGASSKSIEDINKARRQTVSSGKLVGNFPLHSGKIGAGGKGKRMSVSMGGGAPSNRLRNASGTQRKPIPKPSPSQDRRSSILSNTSLSVSAEHRDTSGAPGGGGREAGADRGMDTAAQRLSSRRLTSRAPSLLEDIINAHAETEASSTPASQQDKGAVAMPQRGNRRKSSVQSTDTSPSKNAAAKASPFAPTPKGGLAFLPAGSASSANPALQAPPDDLLEVIQDRRAFQCLLLLETHPSLANVFKGITSYVGRNAAEFLDWRDSLLQQCSNLEGKRLTREEDVLDLLSNIQPPVCLDSALNDSGPNEGGEDRGLFQRGYELSVLQSLILSEALWPGMATKLMDLVWIVLRRYLLKGGHAVVYGDELLLEDEDAFEDNDDDDDDDDEDDEDDKGAKGKEEDDDEDDDEDDEEEEEGDRFNAESIPVASSVADANRDPLRKASQSSFFKSLKAYETSLDDDLQVQDNLSVTNCWKKLDKALSSEVAELPLPEIVNFFTASTRTIRDYYNWEAVLVQVTSDYLEIDKFVFMKELRETITGSKSTYFLAPFSSNREQPQLSIFSQRARDYSLLSSRHVPIIFCDMEHMASEMSSTLLLADLVAAGNAFNSLSGEVAVTKVTRGQLAEITKTIKQALMASSSKKAILERLDLASSEGTAILYSVLMPVVVHRQADQVSGGSWNAISVSTSKNTASSLSQHKEEGRNWKEHFPLIATSAWGKVYQTFADRVVETGESSGGEAGKLLPSSTAMTTMVASGGDTAFAPPIALAELSFAWLPRFFAPDIVRLPAQISSPHSSILQSSGGSPAAVSMPESCGVLYEELEASLLWVINATKLIKRTRITKEVLQRLNRTNKLQTRMISTLLTISQLYGYLRAQSFESQGLQGLWSACLTPMDLWQLSRVIVKLSELMDVTWKVPRKGLHFTRAELLAHEPFQSAVKVLLESFSRPGMDFYSYSPRLDLLASPSSPIASTSPAKKKLWAAIGKSAASSARDGSILSKMNGLKTLALQLKPSLAAIMDNARQAGRESTEGGGATRQASDGVQKARHVRAQKQWRKAMRKLEETRAQYVHHLSNSLMLRAWYRPSLSPPSSHAPADTAPSSSLSPSSAEGMVVDGIEQQQVDDLNALHQHRWQIFVQHYIAEILVIRSQHYLLVQDQASLEDDAQTHETTSTGMLMNEHAGTGEGHRSSTRQVRVSTRVEKVATHILNARKYSNKMNIRSVIAEGMKTRLSPERKEQAASWPLEFSLGVLSPEDSLQAFVKWTLDGNELGDNGKVKIGGVDRMRVLRSIKKLSMHVRQQIEAQQQK